MPQTGASAGCTRAARIELRSAPCRAVRRKVVHAAARQQQHPAQPRCLDYEPAALAQVPGPGCKPSGMILVTDDRIGQVQPPLMPCSRSATTGHQHLDGEDPIEYMLKGITQTQRESGQGL